MSDAELSDVRLHIEKMNAGLSSADGSYHPLDYEIDLATLAHKLLFLYDYEKAVYEITEAGMFPPAGHKWSPNMLRLWGNVIWASHQGLIANHAEEQITKTIFQENKLHGES